MIRLASLLTVVALAHPAPRRAGDPRWAAIRAVFGQEGEAHEGYFRLNFPRSDLTVRIGNDQLETGFELTSYLGFVPAGPGEVLAVGEVILKDDELDAALAEAHRQGVRTPALHNHLVGEQPRILYMHVMARGKAEVVARELKAVFARTATSLAPEKEKPASVTWSAIDAILGAHAEAEGRVAEFVFPRRERLALDGIPVKSSGMLETASEVVFQQLDGGRAACGGELSVLPGEIDAVTRALEEHGLHVMAVHNHLVAESPTMYWIHWYTTGDPANLARGVASALSKMNGALQSRAEP